MAIQRMTGDSQDQGVVLPASADTGDFAIFYDTANEYWLAYELQRDFLSSPRAYAIARVYLGPEGWAVLTDGAEEPGPRGLSVLSEAPWHLQLRSEHRLLEIGAQSLTLGATRYQHAGAAVALLEALQVKDAFAVSPCEEPL